MDRTEFESRVRKALDAIQRRERIESSMIELKSAWPDAGDAARQICGLCNSGRGSPVILIIGADERSGAISGADDRDLDSWYRSLEKWFGEGAPRLIQDLAVQREDRSVRALLFNTVNRPYSVRVPMTDGRPGEILEYPIRRATGTRSALREDLKEMASRLVVVPRLEFVSGRIMDRLHKDENAMLVLMQLYCEPLGPGPVTITPHRLSVELWAAVDRCYMKDEWASFGAHKLDVASVEFRILSAAPGVYVPMKAVSSEVPTSLDMLVYLRGPHLVAQGIPRFGVRVIARGPENEESAVAQGLFSTFNQSMWNLEVKSMA